jgi:hypothetical protein
MLGPLKTATVGPGPATYLVGGDALIFALYGAAAAITALMILPHGKLAVAWTVALGVAILGLGLSYGACLSDTLGGVDYRQTPARYTPMVTMLCLLAGFLVTLNLNNRRGRWSALSAVVVLCLALLGVMGFQAWQHRSHLPVSEFDRAVRLYLERQGEGDAILLVPHQQETLQARLGHPVMTDLASFNLIPYRPSMGPSQYKVYRDFYEINFVPRKGEQPYPTPEWEYPERVVWPRKSKEEWQRLSEEYGFRYIIAPDFITLEMPTVLSGDGNILYVVPLHETAAEHSDP